MKCSFCYMTGDILPLLLWPENVRETEWVLRPLEYIPASWTGLCCFLALTQFTNLLDTSVTLALLSSSALARVVLDADETRTMAISISADPLLSATLYTAGSRSGSRYGCCRLKSRSRTLRGGRSGRGSCRGMVEESVMPLPTSPAAPLARTASCLVPWS